MSTHNQHVAARRFNAANSPRSHSFAAAILRCILPRLEYGRLVIEAPSGESLVIEGNHPGPHARMAIHDWRCLWRVITGGGIGFAESYIAGEWSSPTLDLLMNLALRNVHVMAPTWPVHTPGLLRRLRHGLNRNTRRGSRRNIAAHYDLGNEFYVQWLDESMSYSSALFSSANQTLESAQNTKLERVFDLLELLGGEQVLEIGCGWGGLAERAIGRYRCHVTGLTLSMEQLEFASARLRDRNFEQYGDIRLQDYRDVRGSYDRIVSIEMLEAVGADYWSTYFETLRARLRPGGIAVLQVITMDEGRFENYRRRPDFIQKYIFPGGMLPTRKIIAQQIAATGLQLVASEFFGESYARTLAEWQRRFQQTWPVIERLGFDDRFKRMWEFYLTYCQAGFQAGTVDVGLYKIVRAAGP
jgi:cyclopropane-fatty-acyl-phospholipid synthase